MNTKTLATLRDLIECWEGEASRCDANAKRLGGGWSARAKTLRDCANTLKKLAEQGQAPKEESHV